MAYKDSEKQKAAQRRHYLENKDQVIAKAKRLRQRNCEFVVAHLREQGCKDCGETDPVVLELDHQYDKAFLVSDMIRRRFSLAKLSEEIAKCEVVCANCHRRRTANTFGWHRLLC